MGDFIVGNEIVLLWHSASHTQALCVTRVAQQHMHIHPAPAAAACVSCSDEMGDFIVGNETVDRRRERRDAKMALEQGLSTEAVQARTLGFVWSLRRFHCHASNYCFICSFRSRSSRGRLLCHMWLLCMHDLGWFIITCAGCSSLCV
jgi:hypothetical protein